MPTSDFSLIDQGLTDPNVLPSNQRLTVLWRELRALMDNLNSFRIGPEGIYPFILPLMFVGCQVTASDAGVDTESQKFVAVTVGIFFDPKCDIGFVDPNSYNIRYTFTEDDTEVVRKTVKEGNATVRITTFHAGLLDLLDCLHAGLAPFAQAAAQKLKILRLKNPSEKLGAEEDEGLFIGSS